MFPAFQCAWRKELLQRCPVALSLPSVFSRDTLFYIEDEGRSEPSLTTSGCWFPRPRGRWYSGREKNILINCNSLTVIYFASSYTIFPSERKVYFNIQLVNEWSLVTKRDGMQTLGYLFLRIQSVDPLMLLREEESCEACSKGIRNKYFSPVEEISNLSPKHDLSFLSYSRTLFCQWHFERESYSMRATVRGTQFYWTFDRQSTLWECQGNKGTLAPRDSW